jgi:hypothetical protein
VIHVASLWSVTDGPAAVVTSVQQISMTKSFIRMSVFLLVVFLCR